MVTFKQLEQNKGSFVYITINSQRIRAQIVETNNFKTGAKWVTFRLMEHTEFSPTFFGSHTGRITSLYCPKNSRDAYGYMSEQVFDKLEMCNPQAG